MKLLGVWHPRLLGVGTRQTRLLTSPRQFYFVAFTANMALKSGVFIGNRVVGIGKEGRGDYAA